MHEKKRETQHAGGGERPGRGVQRLGAVHGRAVPRKAVHARAVHVTVEGRAVQVVEVPVARSLEFCPCLSESGWCSSTQVSYSSNPA